MKLLRTLALFLGVAAGPAVAFAASSSGASGPSGDCCPCPSCPWCLGQ